MEKINIAYILDFLKDICQTPSPTGFAHKAIEKCEAEAKRLGFATSRNNKGGLIIDVPGKTPGYKRLVTGHVDTLGAMVRSVGGNGWLRITPIGSYMMQTVEGEYCTIFTRDGRMYSGTCLTDQPSVHVFEGARNYERKPENMVIRIDEKVKDKTDTENLGIMAGDFIAWDSRTEITESGFVKSRHLDDKAGVAVIFGALEAISSGKVNPEYAFCAVISNYEEVGHGASFVPNADEMLAVDMGAVGSDLTTDEYKVSICAKDSSGPYDFDMTTQLVNLAKSNSLNYSVDIYPFYGSDASAALHAGHNIRAALIGPGVQASHSMERTHKEGLEHSARLLAAYLESPKA